MSYTVPDNISDVRKAAWATRRAKYGQRGHKGAYDRPSRSRYDAMLRTILELHAEAVLSEGQVAQLTGLDRVEIRRLVEPLAPA